MHAVSPVGPALHGGHALDVDDWGAVDAGEVGIGQAVGPRREGRGREGRGAVRDVEFRVVARCLDEDNLADAGDAAALLIEEEVVVPEGARSDVSVVGGDEDALDGPEKRSSGAVPAPGRKAATNIADREMLPVERSCYFGNTE